MQDPVPSFIQRFLSSLPADGGAQGASFEWTERDTRELVGRESQAFTSFMRLGAHSSHGMGILRFLLPGTKPSLTGWGRAVAGAVPHVWRDDWPAVARGVVVATDWMGRLFFLASDFALEDGEPCVGRLDPMAAEHSVLEIGFEQFVGAVLVDEWRALLDADAYDDWRALNARSLGFQECVVPVPPLFLGGSMTIGKTMVLDVEVATSIGGQAWTQAKDLPPGTRVSGFKFEK